jgi:hypothetical protein
LFWNRETDTLLLPIVDLSLFCASGATKRDFLRGISSVFDPLGFIVPLSIPARILFQEIWKIKLDGEEPLPPSFYDRWIVLAASLNSATSKIPRSYLGSSSRVHSLYGFVYASPQAYGAVAYLLDQSSFVMSKARVAPLKSDRPQLTLPQLELMAAIIRIRVATAIIVAFKALGISLSITMLSDSQIVLWWLSRNDRNKNLFVANRQHYKILPATTWPAGITAQPHQIQQTSSLEV